MPKVQDQTVIIAGENKVRQALFDFIQMSQSQIKIMILDYKYIQFLEDWRIDKIIKGKQKYSY